MSPSLGLPGPVQQMPPKELNRLTFDNTCNFFILCFLNILTVILSQIDRTEFVRRLGFSINVAWFALATLMVILNFLHRGNHRYTSYILFIALVALFSFTQHGGSIPLYDVPFIVDVGLALGWSVSRPTLSAGTLVQGVTHGVMALLREDGERERQQLSQMRQAPLHQMNQSQPHRQE